MGLRAWTLPVSARGEGSLWACSREHVFPFPVKRIPFPAGDFPRRARRPSERRNRASST